MVSEHIIGIISDSHDNKEHIIQAVKLFNERSCSVVLHAGDFVAPFTAQEFSHLQCPLIGVFGNNDGERIGLQQQFGAIGMLHDMPYEFVHFGKRFMMMHEPEYLEASIARNDLDVIVYGHTHKIDIRAGKPLVINPGESCAWLTNRATVVVLNMNTMEPELVDL